MEPKDREVDPSSSTGPTQPTPTTKKARQTASSNPVSPDDWVAGPVQFSDGVSWIPVAIAFIVGLGAGLLVGILIARH